MDADMGEEMTGKRDMRERRLASSEARNVAIRRLKIAHPEEYRRLYEEEAVKRGLKPHGKARARRIERLRAELRELEEGEQG